MATRAGAADGFVGAVAGSACVVVVAGAHAVADVGADAQPATGACGCMQSSGREVAGGGAWDMRGRRHMHMHTIMQ